jgi:hypothetical protein
MDRCAHRHGGYCGHHPVVALVQRPEEQAGTRGHQQKKRFHADEIVGSTFGIDMDDAAPA